ncbi:MAG: ribonuclease HII [Holophagales bacterium]|nr:ribonuclease HII [Holophagales bacterium]
MGEVFAEAYRLRLLRGLEEGLRDFGYPRIAGVDDAGRGCLAGPVVAAAVLVEGGTLVPGVDDSKQLPAAKRERLAEAIRRAHPVCSVAAIGPRRIDRLNILQATRLAMVEALARLRPRPDLALVDAVPLDTPIRTLSLIRGDQISYAVACASILAKVERDRAMAVLDRLYPHYGFAGHKGYGTAAHREALAEHGPCEAHRLTFKSVLPRRGDRLPMLRDGHSRARAPRRAHAPAPPVGAPDLFARSGSALGDTDRERRGNAIVGGVPWR